MPPNSNPITYFGETDARNKKIKFGIKAVDRLKHMYVIGKTGMGKSTLLENMAIQDIQNGEGLAFIDPHGSTAEKLLEYVPEHRIKDVLYFAPFDMEHPIAFNVMEDVDPDKRHLVVNGLMATFEKLWADAWSARMAYILQYSILALLEYPDSTLLGINKMLSDKEYRKKVVDNVTDASVKSFWIDEFGKYTERFAAEATPAIQNKVGQFTSNALVRNIVGQSQSSFDLRTVMDQKKILIINLSKGQVGEGNAKLLGSMLITKIYLAAMSRADKSREELNKLPNFYLYVDEFQSFANKSFADILSEARKYKLNLTIAHQYVEQMEEEVRDAVFGNVGTMITFRVGAPDAELLEKEFAPVFTAEDLVNLGFTQIYLKLMIDGVSSAPFSATSLDTPPKPVISFKAQVVESSQKMFGRVRKEVEDDVTKFYEGGRAVAPAPRPNNEGRSTPSSRTEFTTGHANYEGDRRQSFNQSQNGGGQNQSTNVRQNVQIQVPTPARPEFRAPLSPELELNAGKIENRIMNNDVRNTNSAEREKREEIKKEDANKMIFAQAAEEIKNRITNNDVRSTNEEKNQNKISENRNSNVVPRDSKNLSLNDLRPEHEKAKMPTKENVSSLKDALASVMGKKIEAGSSNNEVRITNQKEGEKKPEIKEEIKQENKTDKKEEKKSENKVEEKKVETKATDFSSRNSNSVIRDSSPREVPEDVLRKLLAVEEPKV